MPKGDCCSAGGIFLVRSEGQSCREGEWGVRAIEEHLHSQMLAVMAKNGKEGMNALQIAEHLHQDAIRIRKFIADNPKLLKKTGNGAGTKFFLL